MSNPAPRVAVFTLPEAIENDDHCFGGRYQFKDRELHVSESEGALLARILCRFHGCDMKMVTLQPAPTKKASPLAKETTQKPSETAKKA